MTNEIRDAALGLTENPAKKFELAKALKAASASVADFLKEKSEKEAKDAEKRKNERI